MVYVSLLNTALLLYLIFFKNQSVKFKLKKIMATQAELAQSLNDLAAQVSKSREEILKKIQDLEDAINNDPNETTPEVNAALAALKAEVQSIDDVVPDEVPPPDEEEGNGEEEETTE